MHYFTGPLFVIGAPRSGTKLLMNLLNNHPEILLANEFESHAALLNKWEGKSLTHYFDNFYEDLIQTYYYMTKNETFGLTISKNRLKQALQPQHSTADALLVFMRLAAGQIEGKRCDTQIIGQKSPHLTDKIKTLKKFYPGSKFIHIIRNVNNAAVSSKKTWQTDIYRYAQRWHDRVSHVVDACEKMSPDACLHLRYEDLTSTPDKELRRICRFLSINFDESILTISKPTEYYGDAKHLHRILKQDDRKYLKYLSRSEIRKVERITFPALKRFHYAYSCRGSHLRLSKTTMLMLQAKDVYFRFIFDLKEKGLRDIDRIVRLKLAHFKN